MMLLEMIEILHLPLILLLIEVKMLRGDGGFPSGYCQVYSYNINHRGIRISEKHFFICCNNIDEKACQGYTYQKSSRVESFCTGQVIQKEGSHWTQMETVTFPDNGRFYCGGCCGQHLAMATCNQEMSSARKVCTNWVQCFQKECQSVVAAVLSNQPLKCSLPPPPYPKHFIKEHRTLPGNLTVKIELPANKKISHSSSLTQNATCSTEWCQNINMSTRCQQECCERFCCLQEGSQDYLSSTLIWGLTTVQVIGIVIGSVAVLTSFIGIALLSIKQCGPSFHSIQVPTNDTEILVIQGPDDAESDPEDSA